ncbi:MAG: sulfotransferase [Oscillatoria sp. PMC 1051.18]|nr:sulfotransferase [Oscillatoria sp. PMC 1050.18]MEC5031063.1 sulfotransferase [Oscillatoria sp. PMC 1051.18]
MTFGCDSILSPPVFIGGSGSSGTTLLVDMLGLHSQLSPIYETKFVLDIARLLLLNTNLLKNRIYELMEEWTLPLPYRPHQKSSHERYHHGSHYILFTSEEGMAATQTLLSNLRDDNALSCFREFVTSLFAYHCAVDGKPRWINKLPLYLTALPLLLEIFPAMKFIHCVRDGRDVACSVIKRSWGPDNYVEVAQWWQDQVSMGVQFEQTYPDICRTIRYEDLIISPDRVLPDIFAWLGVTDETKQIVDTYSSGDPNKPTLNTTGLNRWQREAAPQDIVCFQQQASDALKSFGYLFPKKQS